MYGPPRGVAQYRSNVSVDEGKCLGCGLCTRVCPAEALRIGTNRIVAVDKLACGGCYKCVGRCPVHALQMHFEYIA